MSVPLRQLVELSGYIESDELEPEEIEITDPEIRIFFSENPLDDFTEFELDLIRQAIKLAQAYKDARESQG
jgi:hypothetical protein